MRILLTLHPAQELLDEEVPPHPKDVKGKEKGNSKMKSLVVPSSEVHGQASQQVFPDLLSHGLIFIKHVVAVAAYIRLTRQKF